MTINYGLLDTSIPEKLGAIPGNALAAALQVKQQAEDRALARDEAGMRNSLARMQLTRGQREMDEEDAYKNALGGVQGGDYAAAMPELLKASPTRALAFKKSLAEEQKSGLETTLTRFKVIDHVAGQFAANPTRKMGVWVLSKLAESGTPPAVIQEMSVKLNAAKDEDLPKMAQAFLAATQEGMKAHVESMFPKPAAPSDLARLIAERDTLPPNDPRRATYDQAIQKATTHAPVVAPPQVFLTGEGGQQFLVDPRRPGARATPVLGPDGKPIAKPVPASNDPIAAADAKRARSAENALNVLAEAEKWIDTATSSYLGAARDVATRAVGESTEASQAAARLRALQGALMMAQPRMEGPQSDKDVALYREMAGRIGDPTVPAADKRAAIDTIRRLHAAYAPRNGGAAAGSAPPGSPGPAPVAASAGMDRPPPPAQYVGRTIRDSTTGVRYRSDGKSWVRVQ